MLFTSAAFVFFIAVFFMLYWYVFGGNLKLQNLFILTGSFVFYAWWDWRFLFLLAGSCTVNYFLGIRIAESKNEKYRNFLLWTGLSLGLASLLFFKYFNFFVSSLISTFRVFHLQADIHTLNITLPLGISFYTFKTLSYLLDIKSEKIRPATDWVVFYSYVSFFPALLSGPIDRPKTLILQLQQKRVFDYHQASDGMRQILWGLFKKIVIADNCAALTNPIFDHYKVLPASSLLFAVFLFTIQLYADFSGYSDMAIGLASLLGFKITRNFNFPFFAQSIPDFWRRWHISLTNWFTDYVFTPLNIYFRNYGKAGLILAISINFTAIGIWHGANWTFILFGFLHGCFFIPSILRGSINKKKKNAGLTSWSLSLKAFINASATFILLMLTFIIFRANSLAQVFDFYHKLFSPSIFYRFTIVEKINTTTTLIAIAIMLWAEWLQQDKQHALQIDAIKRFPGRALIYFGLIFTILFFSPPTITDFIYFKF